MLLNEFKIRVSVEDNLDDDKLAEMSERANSIAEKWLEGMREHLINSGFKVDGILL